MVRRSMRLCMPLLALCALLPACDRHAPAPRPDPAPTSQKADAATDASTPVEQAVVPKGCEINLSGRYRLSKKPGGRFEVEDDGTHLTARPIGGFDGGSDPGALTADRTPNGFVGLVLGTARTATGKDCAVAFKAEIVACSAQGVTLRSDDAVAVDEKCRMRRDEGSATDKVLLRE